MGDREASRAIWKLVLYYHGCCCVKSCITTCKPGIHPPATWPPPSNQGKQGACGTLGSTGQHTVPGACGFHQNGELPEKEFGTSGACYPHATNTPAFRAILRCLPQSAPTTRKEKLIAPEENTQNPRRSLSRSFSGPDNLQQHTGDFTQLLLFVHHLMAA